LRILFRGTAALLLLVTFVVPVRAASFEDLYTQGRAARARGDFVAAETSLRAAVAAQSGNVEALNLLALVQAYQNHYEDATTTIDHAVALAPNDLDVILTRARILAWTKRYTEAESAVGRVLQAQPDNSDALALRGRLSLYQNRLAQAEEAFRGALQRDASNLDAVLGLGDIARAKGDETTARQYYAQGQKLDPQSRDVADRLQSRIDNTPLWRFDVSGGISALSRTAQPDWSEQSMLLERRLSATASVRAGVYHARRFSTDDLEVGAGTTFRVGDGVDIGLDGAVTPKANFLPVWRIAPSVTAQIVDDFTFALIEGHIRHYKTGTVKSANLGVQRYFWDGRLDVAARFINSFDATEKHVMGWSIAGGIVPVDRVRLRASYAEAPESESGIVADTRSWSVGVAYDLTPTVAVRFGFLRENRERTYIRKEYSGGLTLRF
jgi:YaiO family outer membrane protein